MAFFSRAAAPRLRRFDYRTSGAYFVTACLHARRRLLGRVHDGVLEPSALGRLVREAFELAARQTRGARVERVVPMPDHVHAIVHLERADGLGEEATSLVDFVGRAKAHVSREGRRAGLLGDEPLWQRGFFDRVLRDEDELLRYRAYADENPKRWTLAGKT